MQVNSIQCFLKLIFKSFVIVVVTDNGVTSQFLWAQKKFTFKYAVVYILDGSINKHDNAI